MERKLAAILAADVAGYSRLMGVDEEGTLHALRSHREVVDGLIAAHRGRVFHTAGDSVVAEFPSAVEATLCAVEVQQEFARRNEAVPKERRLEFRIGINIGDVIVEDGNLFGDGVNVADRVQKLAKPGGICVSRNVHDQLRNKVGFAFEPMGAHQVKNIAAPVSVYRVLVEGAIGRPRLLLWLATMRHHRRLAAAVALALVIAGAGLWYWQMRVVPPPSGFPSLAVLPFDNLSGDPTLASYGDGVTEDIITTLSRFPDLTVVSRNSSFAYKGKAVDPADVGRELSVDYVLEGSVQKKGDELRISAQLIDARTNLHIWAEGYEGNDPSSLQDEAIVRLAAALPGEHGAITKSEYTRIKDTPTEDLNEYGYHLRGHEIFSRYESIEEHDRAGAIWREGLEKFPDSALLRISLAWYHYWRPADFATDKSAADYRRARELAEQALAGPNLSPVVQWGGRRLMAYMHWFEGDFVRAIADAEAAVALNPYDADSLSFLSRVQIAAGNLSRAIEWVQESTRRKPALWRNTRLLAWAYYLEGDYEKSIEAARRHEELSRGFAEDSYVYMAASYVRLGRIDEARAAVKKLLELNPRASLAMEHGFHLRQPYKDQALALREMADLVQAGLPTLPFGYDERAEDRLMVDEIKTSIFGHTLSGHDESGQTFTDVVALDGTISETADWGPDTATLAYLGDDLICHYWTDWGPSCGAIFRNPSGTPERQNEFAWVFLTGPIYFSVVK